jgi:LacI family transcriptional regulator
VTEVHDGSTGVKHVAARAGVSVGTVSNVLNRPDIVSEATRRKVLRAIAELGFVRNESGRQLRAGRSRTIAYLVLDASNPFFTDVARGIEQIARDAGVALYLCNSDGDVVRETDYLDLLLEQRVRGVLITPVNEDTSQLEALARRGMPVVLVDRSLGAAWCSVGVDDVEGGELAVTHLCEQGHRRIAFVGGPMRTVQVADRLEGTRKALAAAGRPADSLSVIETAGLNVGEGRRAGERLIGLPRARRPTAAFCANDLVALGLLQQMTVMGVEVPGQLAIVGYDDIEFAGAAAVPLSSVRQPRELLGRTAANLLLAESAAGTDHVHEQVVFRPELVVRTSSIAPVSYPKEPASARRR